MPDYKIGTRQDWQAARDELAQLEAEHAKLGQRVTEQRRQLPWVPVEKQYRFDTEAGKKTPPSCRGPFAAARLQHHVRPTITRSAPAPAVRAWAMSSTPRACI